MHRRSVGLPHGRLSRGSRALLYGRPFFVGAADEAQDLFLIDGEQAQPGERAALGHGIDPWG